jgi:trypsin-like peptidase
VTVDPWRVAQLAVERGAGDEGSRGSGYLIAPGRVLTAAHVVAAASVVRVRLDVGQDTEIDVQADRWWADPAGHEGTDLAVVTIPEAATVGRRVESARFGRISDSAAVLIVDAFGFPRFKLRDDPAGAGQRRVFRDFEQAGGHAPVAANRRQRTLAVYLNDPPPRQPPKREPSPWEGMSGGPVWAAGRIVGVVAEHHADEGTGRLTARRINRAYEQLSAADLDRLSELLRLPATLPDVVPADQGQQVQVAYLAQVREDIAPDALIGREDELAAWTEFCAGTDPYAWWQAEAWAGKTALASWFVTHPPAGVDIVSFCITGRLSGQADSDQFLTDLIEQLDALLDPAGQGSPTVAGARAGVWLNRLASAASAAEERSRRLVIVVDGRDEDEVGTTPSRGHPSIASLLPRHPPPGARFIVTSRLGRDLPRDVLSGHPLHSCKPYRLPVSPVAQDLKERAEQELHDLLDGDQIAVDVVGYIAGSGGNAT